MLNEKFQKFGKKSNTIIKERFPNAVIYTRVSTSEQENNQKLENYLNDIPNIWNNVQADIYEDEMDNDSLIDDVAIGQLLNKNGIYPYFLNRIDILNTNVSNFSHFFYKANVFC